RVLAAGKPADAERQRAVVAREARRGVVRRDHGHVGAEPHRCGRDLARIGADAPSRRRELAGQHQDVHGALRTRRTETYGAGRRDGSGGAVRECWISWWKWNTRASWVRGVNGSTTRATAWGSIRPCLIASRTAINFSASASASISGAPPRGTI